jgi:hypothetical protein
MAKDDYEAQRFVIATIEKVRDYGIRVLQLQDLKQVAITNEDYMTAKNIKIEADKVRALVRDMDAQRGFIPKNVGTAELR